ncbi:MAG: hypothetical protein JXJ04_03715 [Spirochaetales bacterium]|nr:hypothetical protein [Spirochaetales bacterium]
MTIKIKILIPLLVLLIGFSFLFVVTIHPFLSLTSPINGEALVVESWIEFPAIKEAAAIFKKNNYSYIIAVGGPKNEIDDWKTTSDALRVAAAFENLGINRDVIFAVPCFFTKKHRTLLSAITVNEWLLKEKPEISGIDILSASEHARKTYILYSKVCRPRIKTGIIAAKTYRYDTDRWFLSRQGVHHIFRNTIGVIYSWFVDIDKVKTYYDEILKSKNERTSLSYEIENFDYSHE